MTDLVAVVHGRNPGQVPLDGIERGQTQGEVRWALPRHGVDEAVHEHLALRVVHQHLLDECVNEKPQALDCHTAPHHIDLSASANQWLCHENQKESAGERHKSVVTCKWMNRSALTQDELTAQADSLYSWDDAPKSSWR